MAASFFENQAQARRSTGVLVLLFALAVVAIVATVNVVGAAAWFWGTEAMPTRTVHVWITGITLAVILFGTLREMIALGGGGEAVAQMCGGTRVDREPGNPAERRLVNIVEEMAIASGVAVPPVYVMRDEKGINAFAAGYAPNQAVVAVTRGALEQLNRDELQAVVGHEFSHILNGDMRLNVRMIGVLAGILFIGAIGEFLMRMTGRSSSKDDSKLQVALFLAGLALLAIGYVGLFFGRLIKAAVSRQREYLADASSVQFTRNPDGIAGALAVIGGLKAGSRIQHRKAETFSHMFFAESVDLWFSSLFATHPAIKDRIRRVHPGFLSSAYGTKRRAVGDDLPAAPEGAMGFAAGGAAGAGAEALGRREGETEHAWGRTPEQSARLVGKVEPAHVDFAQSLIARLPATLKAQLDRPASAAAAIVALLLAAKAEVAQEQVAAVVAAGHGDLVAQARLAEPLVRRLGPPVHLALIELALPAVKRAGPETAQGLIAALGAVIHADRRVSLHEFVVLTLVKARLEDTGRAQPVRYRSVADVDKECLLLLSLVAHAGHRDAVGAEKAFRAGVELLGATALGSAVLPPKSDLKLEAVSTALEDLKVLAPMPKGVLVKALFAAVTTDGSITLAEAELMRMIGAVLDCPLPPLLATLDPMTLAA